jgi:hypothetical protein
MKVNEMIQIHSGSMGLSDIFTYEKFIIGTIVKVNKKSIRVHMTHAKCTTNGKVTNEYDMNETATFTFWKTIENREIGENAGKTVDIYKHSLYGIIEIAH